MSMNADIRVASPCETEEILALMQRANRFSLEVSGELQWAPPAFEVASAAIKSGNCHVLEANARIIGSVTLLDEDPGVWGAEGIDGQALYVHKLMAEPAETGRNIGRRLLAHAAGESLSKSRTLLRLDCRASQIDLREYYEKQGFNFVRILPPENSGYSTASLYQTEACSLANYQADQFSLSSYV